MIRTTLQKRTFSEKQETKTRPLIKCYEEESLKGVGKADAFEDK